MPNINGNRINSQNRKNNNFKKRRQKIPFKKEMTEKQIRVGPAPKYVHEQRAAYKTLNKLTKIVGWKEITELYRGSDYVFNIKQNGKKRSIKINYRNGYGRLGDGNIVVRVRDPKSKSRELIDNSAWTMVLTKDKKLVVFQTQILQQYLKRCWGRVAKDYEEYKGHYSSFPININDVFEQLRMNKGEFELSVSGLRKIQQYITTAEIGFIPKKNSPQVIKRPIIQNKNGINKNRLVTKPKIVRTGTRHQ